MPMNDESPPATNVSRPSLRFIIERGVVSLCCLLPIWLMKRPILLLKEHPTNYFEHGQLQATALICVLVAVSACSLAGTVRLALLLAGSCLGLIFAFVLKAVETSDELLQEYADAGIPSAELNEIYNTSGPTLNLFVLIGLVSAAALLLLYVNWRQWRILTSRRREE
jgi:hypothetical protein